jgi:hypothetical protein
LKAAEKGGGFDGEVGYDAGRRSRIHILDKSPPRESYEQAAGGPGIVSGRSHLKDVAVGKKHVLRFGDAGSQCLNVWREVLQGLAHSAFFEAEIFLYDTLAGGAGFSPQLVDRGAALFREALEILSSCPAGCDASCYRRLRSFRNKLEHRLLDRHLGEQLLRHALFGGYPAYSANRTTASLDIMCADLTRQFSATFEFRRNVARIVDGREVTIPILAIRQNTAKETWLTLSSPIAPLVPVQEDLRSLDAAVHPIVCVDDLLVRHHLPQAVQTVMGSAR